MLEPRRVAARSIAHYLATSLNQKVGQQVGYRIKGDTKISANTRLEIVTEGVLTKMIQADPELTDIGLIIFDEIHERHLTTDLGLALALEVQASLRDDLVIMAMSATLSGLPLLELMPDAAVLSSEGRSYPVTHAYYAAKTQQDWLPHMGQIIVKLVHNELDESVLNQAQQKGSVLAFLPGKGEILRLQRYLAERLDAEQFDICPLYGELTAAQQDRAIAAAVDGKRKIVLSTNVAESSLTIDGISLVVDSGYRRDASFNPKTGSNKLTLKRISQASAIQRSGRAGRLSEGHCIRLWGQEEHGRLAKVDAPEIVQSELTSLAFEAANWGVRHISDLPLLTPPTPANEQVAWQLLQTLALVDEQHKLTVMGQHAYQMGCEPRLAHMLLQAKAQHARLLPLACALVTLLQARGLPRKGTDLSNYFNLLQQGILRQEFRNWLKKFAIADAESELMQLANPVDIGYLLAQAYPDRIAKRRSDGRFLMANGSGVMLDDQPLAYADWLVVADFGQLQGQSDSRVYLAVNLPQTVIDKQLETLISDHTHIGFDEAKGRFIGELQRKLGQIVLSAKAISRIEPKQLTQGLCELLLQKGLGLLDFNDSVRQLQIRMMLAKQWLVQHDWPDVSDETLLLTLNTWLAPYLTDVRSLAALKNIDIYPLLLNQLPWEQQQLLAQQLPKRFLMATGTHANIAYQIDGRALISIRLQEALGMAQSPILAQGKLVVTMELLSPAMRPLALTADLASFWQGPYVDVKKEMKGRYPKHLWPDDPANTLPTKMTKKKTLAAQAGEQKSRG